MAQRSLLWTRPGALELNIKPVEGPAPVCREAGPTVSPPVDSTGVSPGLDCGQLGWCFMPVMENIRQGANSPFMKILFGIIVIVFVFFGVTGGLSQATVIARVNGTDLTDTPLRQKMRQITRGQAVSAEQEAFYEEQIILQLIQEELLFEEAEKMGLVVSDHEIALQILSTPAFQDADGNFSKKLMEQAIAMNGWRKDRYEGDIRDGILLSKVQESVQRGVGITDEEVRKEFMAQRTQMSVNWVLLSPDALRDDVPVDDAAVDAYLSANETQVQARYDAEKARRWSQPRKFQYSTILLRTDLAEGQGKVDEAEVRKRLEAVLDEARGGAEFAQLARIWSEDLTAARGGEQGMMREDQIDKALVEQMASVGEGGVTDIVETPLGYVIAHVTLVKDAEETVFADAKGTIARELIAEEGLAAFTEGLVSELLEEWKKGAAPTARLDDLGLRLQAAGPFSPTAPKLVGAGSSDELTAALTALPAEGVLDRAFTTSVGTLLVEVSDVQAPAEAEYELLKPTLRMQMLQSKRSGFIQAWRQDLMDQASIERIYKPLEQL